MPDSSATSLARELIERYRRDQWRGRRDDDLIKAVSADPVAVVEFMRLAIDEWPPDKLFVCDLSGRLPAASFGGMIRHALKALDHNSENIVAAAVIARISLQAPCELHPYLNEVFRLRPNESTYYAPWPWREAGDAHSDFLCARVTPTRGDFALSALLETRTQRALAFVAAWGESTWQAYFHFVGYDLQDGTPRRLYDPQPRHLCPPTPPKATLAAGYGAHPTWQFDETHPRRRFGGTGHRLCCACGETNHHLITLEAADLPANVTSRPRLSVETCLSCLGWANGPLFYAHDAEGIPGGVHFDGEPAAPQFPAGPFPEMEMRVVPTASHWIWQDWGLSSLENLHRVGGHPCWVQDAEYLECPQCQRTMSFLLQLDSSLNGPDGNEWLWGSGGVCYVLWCDACAISGLTWQCT